MTAGLVFDAALATALPVIAWRSVTAPDLFRACVLYVAFGMLVGLAWARLGAGDIALVEAAVGAGLTGALLLGTLTWLSPEEEERPGPRTRAVLAVVPVLVVVVGLVVFAHVPAGDPGLEPQVAQRLRESGVEQPVTAVLLAFRAQDTLFEVMVLLTAVITGAGLALTAPAPETRHPRGGPLLHPLAAVVGPAGVVIAVYLMWMGSRAPGGAFQGAAALAAAGVLLILARHVERPHPRAGLVRIVLVMGPVAFLAVAAATLLSGALLEYPDAWAHRVIVAIEAALLPSLALILLLFVPPLRPGPGEEA